MVSKTFKIFLCTIFLISVVGFSMSFVSATDVDANGVVDFPDLVPVNVDSTSYISDSSVCSQSEVSGLNDFNSLSSSNPSVYNLKESGVSSNVEKLDDNNSKPSSNNVKKFVNDKDKSKKFIQQDNLGDVDSINEVNTNVATAITSVSFAKDTVCFIRNIVSSSKNNVYSAMDDIYGAVSDVKSDSCIKSSNVDIRILPYCPTSFSWML